MHARAPACLHVHPAWHALIGALCAVQVELFPFDEVERQAALPHLALACDARGITLEHGPGREVWGDGWQEDAEAFLSYLPSRYYYRDLTDLD